MAGTWQEALVEMGGGSPTWQQAIMSIYSSGSNIIPVGPNATYKTVQDAVNAAAAQFVATGMGVTVLDRTGGAYTPAPGVTVEYYKKSPLGRPCSILTRLPRGAWNSYTAATGTSLGVGSASFWPLPNKVNNLRVVFLNDTCAFEQTTPITVHGSIIDSSTGANNAVIPLTFGGQPTITVAAHGIAVSDPLPNVFDATQLEVRSYATAANALLIPCEDMTNMHMGFTADACSLTDHTDGSTFTVDTFGTTHGGFAPYCLLGDTTVGNEPVVYVIGDSITDYESGGDTYYSALCTIFQQALGNITIPTFICGWAGQTPTGHMAHPATLFAYKDADIVISAYGRNNITIWDDSTPATNPFKLAMIRWWSNLRSLGIKKIYQVKVTPYTKYNTGGNGTDTPSNQLEHDSGIDIKMKAGNSWMAAQVTAGLIDGIIDWGRDAVVENGANPTITTWKTGMADLTDTGSLAHPSRLGMYVMAQSIDLSAIGLPAKTAQPNLWVRPAGALVDARLLETTAPLPTGAGGVVNSAIVGSATLANEDATYPPISTTPVYYPCRSMTIAKGKINLTSLSFADNTKMSGVAWVYLNGTTSPENSFLYVPAANAPVIYLIWTDANQFAYPSTFAVHDSTFHILRKTWTLFAWTIDTTAGELKFYNNGVAGVTLSVTGTIDHTTAKIGNDDASSSNMLLGEVLIYNSVLTPTQILSIYTNSKSRYGL